MLDDELTRTAELVNRAWSLLSTSDATTDRILDAALAQFELFGISRSTVGDITRRARVARVTVYRRFANKQELVEAVILRELGRFLTSLQEVLDLHPDGEAKLTEGFLFTLDRLRGHELLGRILDSEPESMAPYITVNGGTLISMCSQFLAAQIRNWPDAHERTDLDIAVVSELTVRLVLSFVVTPTTTLDFDDPETAREFARTHLAPLLTVRRDGRR